MNKKKIISTILACAMLPFGGLISASAQDTKPTYVQLNPADASPFNNGEFQGWGTALCWWANRLGYSEKLTNAAAEAFFSDEGLGLDIARYNLGGGDDPKHNHINRSDSKVPGVYSDYKLSSDGKDVESITYDITKDQNQLNIAKAALKANPDLYFEGFSNSAPYFMTKTGCTSGGGTVNSDGTVTSNGNLNNLNDDMYDDFAKFIADATKLFKDNGIEFKSYSPMNEPDTDYWGYGSLKQEGCHFDPGTSQSKMITETRKALDYAGFADVLVAGMDETSLKKTANNLGSLTDEAKTALGRVDTHTYRVDTHTYNDRNYHAQVKAKAQELSKNLWQSEVDGNWDGAALASMIIEDVNGMQPSAWVMWDIIDRHKDSEFVDPTTQKKTEENNSANYTNELWGVGMADHDKEELVLTNKYYVYGQFTKYINPGDTIIASSANTLAAYNKNTGDIKIVANNASNSSDVDYEFDLSGFSTIGTNVREIRTDMQGNEKWAEIKDGALLDGKTLTTTLKANTVTTYLIETGDVKVSTFEPTSTGLKYNYAMSDNWKNYNKYFAVYDKNGLLKAVTLNKTTGDLKGDFTDCTFKLMLWDGVTPKANVISTVSQGGIDYATIIGGGNEIKRGEELQLTLSTNMNGDVTWSIDSDATENGIAEISQTGLLKAKKAGKVTVTAKVGDYTTSKTYYITTYATISGAASIGVGKTSQYTLDTNAEGTPVWSVSDEKVATISKDGTVTGVSAGTVTITATIGDVKATKDIKVTMYTLSGTASCGNATTAPSDANDYRKAADGDLNTYFDGLQNGYVMYDFGNTAKVNTVKLAARNDMQDRTIGGKVQASNDGITWTDLYTITTAIPAGQYTTISSTDLANQNAYRYFRYTNDTNMANIAEFLIYATPSEETAEGAPSVTDIDEMSDDFENSTNIFNASAGDLSADGSQVYATGLERFGNVFIPVKTTAKAELSQAQALTSKDKFRLTFDMFSGWEDKGKDNTFSIKDADGNEVIGFTITGGGYNLNQMRIGGTDVLADVSEKPVIQCKSTDIRNGAFRGANGWQTSSQKYANNMGLNKKVEIIIDGTGSANVSFTGGAADLSYTGTIDTPISVKSLELTGSYNGARGRVVSYDNFDADVISYSSELAAPTPTPEPTAAPTVPESGELINMNFDNGDLTSTSSYGKATGTPKFVTVDNKKCIQFDGTSGTVVTLTDANGNSLLTGQKNITISFKVKPTTKTTSWWFFAAPNSSAQTYQKEQYLGAMTNNGTLTSERYNNSGTRSQSATGAYNTNEWNDVIISIVDGVTDVYVNGTRTSSVDSTVNISDMLGKNSVVYIGKANWGSGEYATGYIDDFVIYNYAYENPLNSLDLGDLTAVTSDITIPTQEGVTWSTSDADVVTTAGKITRSDETKTATLTAKMAKDGVEFTRNFDVTVLGYTAVIDSFKAYADGNKIVYASDYDSTKDKYALKVSLADSDGTAVGTEQTNATGSFDNLEVGKYKITATLSDGTTEKKKVEKTINIKNLDDMSAYLFVHFVDTQEDATREQIYFSVSKDGKTWTTLNNKQPYLTSNVGTQGVRDPYILRGEDGKFFIIATDLSVYNLKNNWTAAAQQGSKSIVVWESSDLVNWSEASLVKINNDNAGCTWAPEACYDPEKDEYMVFWASVVSDDSYQKYRIYRSYTKDFKTFSAPELYIEEPNAVIDTTIIDHEGTYYRFTKNEAKSSITMQECTSLSGDWKDVANYNLGSMTGYEGPTIYKLNGKNEWCLLLDYFSKSKGYKPFVTTDITKGEFTADSDFSFDGTYRHGTVMPITQAEYESLTAE